MTTIRSSLVDDAAAIGPARRLRGELVLPGDKSVSHRALMLAALAAGESRIAGAGDGADVRSTAGACRALGADVDRWTPVPSAQVKSAILLAGLRADGRTTVRETVATRDHTERMLRARGIAVTTERLAAADADGRAGALAVSVEGGRTVAAIEER